MPRFQHLYVVSGKDDYTRMRASRQVLDQVIPEPARVTNIERTAGRELDSRRISDALEEFSLFGFDGARKVLYVDEAEQIRSEIQKELIAAIDQGSARNADDIAILLVYSPDKNPPKAVLDRTETRHHHQCRPLDWKTARPFILDYARSKGLRMSNDAADTLIQHIGQGDAGQLVQEIDKLALLMEGRPISPAAIIRATGHRVGRTVFDFCDAFGERNASKASSILSDLIENAEQEPAAIVIMLGYHVVALLRVCARLEAGDSPTDAASFHRVAFKRNDMVTQARRWTLSELEQATEAILRLDLDLKSGAKDNAYNLISTILRQSAAQIA